MAVRTAGEKADWLVVLSESQTADGKAEWSVQQTADLWVVGTVDWWAVLTATLRAGYSAGGTEHQKVDWWAVSRVGAKAGWSGFYLADLWGSPKADEWARNSAGLSAALLAKELVCRSAQGLGSELGQTSVSRSAWQWGCKWDSQSASVWG